MSNSEVTGEVIKDYLYLDSDTEEHEKSNVNSEKETKQQTCGILTWGIHTGYAASNKPDLIPSCKEKSVLILISKNG